MLDEKTVFIAFDGFKTLEEFTSMAKMFHGMPRVGIKLGLEFFCLHGFYGVNKIEEIGLPVFLDLKLHDIPNTVVGAVKAIKNRSIGGVKMFTVHLSGGAEMLKCATQEIEGRAMVFGVSVLTSLDSDDIHKIGFDSSNTVGQAVIKMVSNLSNFVDGVVCSPMEVSEVKRISNTKLKTLTPGIRLENDQKNDQKRTMTPSEAFKSGSDYLVIGRSILNSPNPKQTLQDLLY